MDQIEYDMSRLSDADLNFLVETVAPEVRDKDRVKRLLEEDRDFRNAFLSDEKTFEKVISEREVYVRISPRLYFEILLRKTGRELEKVGHTIEKGGTLKVAVFDAKEVVDLLSRQAVLSYLADMLSSFARIQSYTLAYRVGERVWRKVRFSDLDVEALLRLCEFADEEHKLAFYKRIADICLFLLGVFPESIRFRHRYPASGETRPPVAGRGRWSAGDYEEEGKKFYKLASEHPAARTLDLSGVFRLFHENFHIARKPLSFMAENFIRSFRHDLFAN